MFKAEKAHGEPQSPPSPAKQILLGARAILSTPGVWVNHEPRTDLLQHCLMTALGDAARFLGTFSTKHYVRACDAVQTAINQTYAPGYRSIPSFNDAQHSVLAVLDMLDQAIDILDGRFTYTIPQQIAPSDRLEALHQMMQIDRTAWEVPFAPLGADWAKPPIGMCV